MPEDIKIETLVASDAAVAKVTVNMASGLKGVYTASSKKHPKDWEDQTLGEVLALARVLRKVSDDLLIWTNRQVEKNAEFQNWAVEPFFQEPDLNASSR